MAKAKKKQKVKVDSAGRTMASRMKTSETVAKDAEERAVGLKRENMILRLQNGALMDVIRAHTERVDRELNSLQLVNSTMLSRAKQHQAEGMLRAISEEAVR